MQMSECNQPSFNANIRIRPNDQCIEAVRSTLEKNAKGKVKQCLPNYVKAFEGDLYLQGALRYNELTNITEIVRDMEWPRRGRSLTDVDLNFLQFYLERNYDLNNDKYLRKAVSIVATRYSYHPIREYLNGLHWDGTERIRYALHHFLGADTSDLTYESLKMFLLGAVQRAYHPGQKFEYSLCLVGGQGLGKSSFFRYLAVNDDWFSDDLHQLNDDKIYRRLQGHWIIEMAEMLATANAKSIEEIKSFLSRQKENYKVPYEVHPEDRPRQCVFGGTTNKQKFLPFDRTGNRRFLPVLVGVEKPDVHILDDDKASRQYIDQLWAEVMELYRSGNYSMRFSPEMEQQLDAHRREFMTEDTLAGQIQGWLDDYTGTHVCTLQLFKEALNHPFVEPKRYEVNEISEVMNTAVTGWVKGPQHRFSAYGRQRSWVREGVTGQQELSTDPAESDDFRVLGDEEDCPFDAHIHAPVDKAV
jgi:predicted P-loop ATPase